MIYHLKFILVAIVLSISIGFTYREVYFASSHPTSHAQNCSIRIPGWVSEDIKFDKRISGVLDPDRVVYKSYRKEGSPPITLFIAYYKSLEKADLSHSPIVCFTGQGWKIKKKNRIEIPIHSSKGSSISVNTMTLKKEGSASIAVFYWFQTPRGAFVNRGLQKISLFFNRLVGREDLNAFVRVTAPISKNVRPEEIYTHIKAFVKDMQPALKEFFL